jgi:hypothetical protein
MNMCDRAVAQTRGGRWVFGGGRKKAIWTASFSLRESKKAIFSRNGGVSDQS